MRSAQAQSSYYYDGGIDTRYNSYEPPQYPSYKPDYKAKYLSDDKNYKSKDSNVSINKLKCINNNLNLNGNNSGDFNLDNKGQGYLGANSYGGGYYDEYGNKQGKGFDCVINNNNTNTNINLGFTGNQTIPPDTITCEECFTENLTPEQLAALTAFVETLSFDTPFIPDIPIITLERLCILLSLLPEDQLFSAINVILLNVNLNLPPEDNIPDPIFQEIFLCIAEAFDAEITSG